MASSHTVPEDVLRFLVNPVQPPNSPSPKDALLRNMLSELVRAWDHGQTTRPIAQEKNQIMLEGLASAMRALYSCQTQFGDAIAQRILLKSLMPMYLAASQGHAGNALSESLTLFRMALILIELERVTERELSIWLRDEQRAKIDPMESLEKSFQICLPFVSDAFWNELYSQQPTSAQDGLNLIQTKSPAEKYQNAWWSLACQLTDRSPQIAVPMELSIGVVSWDLLRDHWKRVLVVLAGGVPTDASRPERTGDSSLDDTVDDGPNLSNLQSTRSNTGLNDCRFVEIRSANDPQLISNLDHLLAKCRTDSGILSLLVVKKLRGETSSSKSTAALQNWQSRFIGFMDSHGDTSNVRGFLSDNGELCLVYQEVDRSQLAQWIRDSFAKFSTSDSLATPSVQPLVAGVAMVSAPSRSFQIDQLIRSAWRCLDGAATQGAGAVKTIEVY